MDMAQTDSSRSKWANRFQNSYILQAWLCITLALVFGIALAGVQATLGPRIIENKLNESKARVPELLLGKEGVAQISAQGQKLMITPRNLEFDKHGIKKFYTVFEARFADGRLAGWVTKVGGQGYSSRIELLIGLSPEMEKITGLFVLDQKETPGLGNKISESKWRDQFLQKSTEPQLQVVKIGTGKANEIDAVSGATISSRSVVTIVNDSVADLKQLLRKAPENEKE